MFRMADAAARLAYIGHNEPPTAAVVKSICVTGGHAAMREKLITGGSN